MEGRNKKLLIWEIAGVFWIIIVGSILHFVYQWSDHSRLIAIFGPVNESVWEHLKMGYWSLVMFTVLEFKFLPKKFRRIFLAKTAGIIALSLLIIFIFYTYTSILNEVILWIDIASYVLGAVLCQVISFKIIRSKPAKSTDNIGLVIFILLGVILIIFTFFPPELPIFRDNNTGRYGFTLPPPTKAIHRLQSKTKLTKVI